MKSGDLVLYKYENTQAIVKIIRKCQNKKYYVLTLIPLKGNIKITGLVWNCKKSLLTFL
jgi:hypothetical protein